MGFLIFIKICYNNFVNGCKQCLQNVCVRESIYSNNNTINTIYTITFESHKALKYQ